jgi:hypothetical protein
MLSFSTTVFGANDISVYIDDAKVTFGQPPIIQEGRTLVPLRAIFEGLGMAVLWKQESKSIVASNDNVVINLQVGNTNASVGNDEAGFIEIELDTAPQNINSSVLVPVRFIGEASGSDVVWNNSTKSVMITSVPEREFIGTNEFNRGYERMGYAIWGTGRSFVIQGYTQSLADGYVSDGFGKESAFGQSYVGTYTNDKYNGFGTVTLKSGNKIKGNYNDGKISEGEFIFTDGSRYKGPLDQISFLPDGTGTYTYANGTSITATFIDGQYQKETDPNMPYDSEGNLLGVGDTVKMYTALLDIFIGEVIQVNGNQVLIRWFDVQDMFGMSSLDYYYDDEEKEDDFAAAQFAGGVNFNTPQWVDAKKLFLKQKSAGSNSSYIQNTEYYPDAFQ